jgi:hypothetical protein
MWQPFQKVLCAAELNRNLGQSPKDGGTEGGESLAVRFVATGCGVDLEFDLLFRIQYGGPSCRGSDLRLAEMLRSLTRRRASKEHNPVTLFYSGRGLLLPCGLLLPQSLPPCCC